MSKLLCLNVTTLNVMNRLVVKMNIVVRRVNTTTKVNIVYFIFQMRWSSLILSSIRLKNGKLSIFVTPLGHSES